MEKLVKAIRENLKIKHKFYTIDNAIFKLHYRITTLMLFVMTLMITSQELIGEHIKCMADKAIPEAILNRFCFFTTTYTVVKYFNASMLNRNEIAHPGVGAMGLQSDEPVKHHAYYQWVPFVLFGQAVMFYIPHLIWKRKEGQRMKKLVAGLENAAFATDRSIKIGTQTVPNMATVEQEFGNLRRYFREHLIVNRSWTIWLITCELLNLFNVIGNIYLTDAFLGGQFISLGPKLIHEGLESTVDPLDVVFPKITKCAFHKYGPSGNIQTHDVMCVMALNIINEKTYTALWFWFMFLLAVTGLGILWRVLTYFLHSRSARFNKLVFSVASSFKINQWKLNSVVQTCSYMDWFFLVYLAKNMDSRVFLMFFNSLYEDIVPTLIDYGRSDKGSSDDDGRLSFDSYKDSLISDKDVVMRGSLYSEINKNKLK